MLYLVVKRLLGVFVLVVYAQLATAAVPFDPRLQELPSDVQLPRWDEARAALAADRASLDKCLHDPGACPSPRLRAWRHLMIGLQRSSAVDQLRAVNSFANAVPYAADIDSYGRRDLWAGPWRFLQSSGDCEDYALAKYAMLLRLGHAAEDLRILVVEDVARGLAHAVLAVRLGGAIWLLDNQYAMPIMATKQRRYVPYYAVNEVSRWLHRLPTRVGTAGGS